MAFPIDERLERLFDECTTLDPIRRERLIERECAGDAALAQELRSLLAAHDAPGGALDMPVALTPQDTAPQPDALLGARFGRWRIDACLGRGGAGDVYSARRDTGEFEQRVAIKVLRRGAVAEVARFEAERRILARLDHPAIAKLLDGGVLDDGRPYAVIEFVDGESLTTYCTARRSPIEQRLDLFDEICEAVAYAHRNLVVHRDLKPGNIFVAANGRVKLLDFGIAKLLEPGGTSDAKQATQAPLTPDYAAPEQLTGAPVTTATDVYALGVVLFELLAGQRPLQTEGLPLARAIGLVLDREAPQASLTARESADAPVSPRAIEGDLDAIIARCLRKDAADRYPAIDALRTDLARHRDNLPVSARAPSPWYAAGRFARRHQWGVAAAFAVFASLLVALAVTSWQIERVARERDIARRVAAREEAVRYYLVNMFRTSIREIRGETVTTKAMLDRSARRVLSEYRDEPRLAGQVVETLADLYGALQDVEGQVPLLEGFLAEATSSADPEAVAIARQKLANLELLRGHDERAAMLLAQADAFWSRDPARYPEQRLEGQFARGALQRAQGDLEGSASTYRAALAARITLSGRNHRETANLYNSLAITLTGLGRMEDALDAYREALAIHTALGRADDLDALIMLGNTGTLAFRTGRTSEAEGILKRAFERQRELAGDSAAVAASMGLYGAALTARGNAAAAVPVLEAAAKLATQFTGEASPLTVQDRLFLVDALTASGEFAPASAQSDALIALTDSKFGAGSILAQRARLSRWRLRLAESATTRTSLHAEAESLAIIGALRKLGAVAAPQLAQALILRGEELLRLQRPVDAVPLLTEALYWREAQLWSGSWELAEARARLAEVLAPSEPARALALLQTALPALTRELGPRHVQTLRAQRLLQTLGPKSDARVL